LRPKWNFPEGGLFPRDKNLGIEEVTMFETTPKMLAKNYFADIMGINLEYALEVYDWQGFYPMTDDGNTVTGFWDKRKDVPDSKIYELDERGLYVRKD